MVFLLFNFFEKDYDVLKSKSQSFAEQKYKI